MIVDCIGCLHGAKPKLDGGDLLIVTGDLTSSDKAYQFVEFFLWLDKQPYRKKVLIAGNHDNVLQLIPPIPESLPDNIYYLCDSGTEFEGLRIWGSPWTKTLPGINPNRKAFTCDTEEELAAKWTLIPEDTDILITHGPPYGILDKTNLNEHAGSQPLYELLYKQHINPRLHIFGHIHESHGQIPKMLDMPSTRFINASHVNESYEPVNKPIRVIL